MEAMRLPKGTESDTRWLIPIKPHVFNAFPGPRDSNLAGRLIRAGSDHAKALRGVIVWLRMEMQTGWMIEYETYRMGVECLSTSSTMHGELKGMRGPELAEAKQAGLEDLVYTRIVTVSYQALRAMYRARRKHRHPDWQIFCDFVETLPYFTKLIMPELGVKKGDHRA
jgi:hypothetical protein